MSMFCFQCEQTAGGKGCTKIGVCGKQPEVANSQDELTCALIGLARAAKGQSAGPKADDLIRCGLFTTVTNVSFDRERVQELVQQVRAEKNKLDASVADFPASELWAGDQDIVSLRSTLLLGLRGMAAYAVHAAVLGKENPEVTAWFYKGLQALGEEHSAEEWLGLLMEFGKVNLACMALLDEANTSAYGHPKPTKVSLTVEKGPFIVVTGHDLLDLKQLLEQTEGKGINVYTHGEMLPAHAYPELKKYAHLKGNFGTAWQNQQKEFDNIPAPILFTTNCLMIPKSSYSDRVFTTSVVAFPGAQHVSDTDNVKDFSALINKAIELGGWQEDKEFTGINGGKEVMTGFARDTIMSVAGTVIDAVKAGAIKHFFLVGGCDGAKPGRNYYTEFVKKAPQDTVILTLACGKYRFNDLNIGEIGGLPRIMDMGQCNDAYSAIQVAVALADAFKCGVNDLPLTLILSWYEQKAVCILLTLLALGIKNIYIGPSLPAFLSPNVLNILVSKFDLHPLTTPENDLQTILK
ncbi:Hydroxylamine reductase [Sporomusa ovata DSM 2662]|uniref:Hydroxylamine reductase n=1 Tax=Sporomusa ovata TaxID=2378 RepID=A0A0U1L5Y4_9FIRM|nr:hydroxylamine reductase [Sporomusa ovata]EQB24760.1 hydroxylamine reductase [Sporomusa ovata DSM 2662]CQR75106.1 Hydroxylamine reductase [Sporomusa ovata]